MLLPLLLLAIGAILAGYIFKETLIGHNSNEFWKSSIFFLEEIKHDYIPLWFLLLTPLFSSYIYTSFFLLFYFEY